MSKRLMQTNGRHCTGPLRTGTSRSSRCYLLREKVTMRPTGMSTLLTNSYSFIFITLVKRGLWELVFIYCNPNAKILFMRFINVLDH